MIKLHYEYRFWKKTLVEVIKEGEFRWTSFRDIYSGINGKWYILTNWRILIKIIIVQIIMMLVLINMVLNVGHHSDFKKTKAGLIL